MNRLIALSHTFSTRLARLRSDETGLTTVEYIIVLGLVAIAGIGVWITFGETVVDQVTGGRTVR